MNTLSLGEATMLAVARRIARLDIAGETAEAARQYQAHLTQMNDAEQALFKSAVITFAIEEQPS